jgi:Rhodopirellula transposase DDE domain
MAATADETLMWLEQNKRVERFKVRCQLDENTYPAGIRVSDPEMDAVNLTRHDFHGEWNYTISPLALER